MSAFRPPKGTDDILPPQSSTWRRVLREWDEWSEVYGYGLVVTPLFEATEVFERGVGGESEVVQKQMYTFTDRGGRSITLRPEGTAGVVRAYLDAGGSGVMKLSYAGPMFRYEQPQAGRRRQFHQLGIEYLGVGEPLADVEVVEMGYRFLTRLGIGEVELRLNSIGDATCRPGYLQVLREYLEERREALSPDSRARLASNPLRVLDSRDDAPLLADAPSMVQHLCAACSQHYTGVKEGLDQLGVAFVEDPRLVRGLDYYTRTAFEYIGTSLDAAQNALGGGGRYDGLAEALGGKPAPGVGLALGVERIVLALGEQAVGEVDVYLVSEDPQLAGRVLKLAARLRQAGVRTDFDAARRSVKAQFRSADRSRAPIVVVVGDRPELDIRCDGERHAVPPEEITQWVTTRLHR